jgi:D-alanyl-D-alanine dipeptidase
MGPFDKPIDVSEPIQGLPVPRYPLPGDAWYDSVTFDWRAGPADDDLVDVGNYAVRSNRYYSRTDGENWPYRRQLFSDPRILVRRSVALRLASANQRLAGSGLEIMVLDGHRSLAEQQLLWDFYIALLSDRLNGTDPVSIARRAERFCFNPGHFDPEMPSTWPIHMTGGSVDLTIVERGTEEAIFMGGLFDDPSDISQTAYFERDDVSWEATSQDAAARASRRVLWHSLDRAGLVNYPAEWWHYDYGTALWSFNLGMRGLDSPAFYRAIDQR